MERSMLYTLEFYLNDHCLALAEVHCGVVDGTRWWNSSHQQYININWNHVLQGHIGRTVPYIEWTSSRIEHLLTGCVCGHMGWCVCVCVNKEGKKKKGLLSYEMVEFSFCFWGGKYYTLPRFFFFPPITLIWVYNFWIFSFEESLVHFLSLYFNHSWINICWINWFFEREVQRTWASCSIIFYR